MRKPSQLLGKVPCTLQLVLTWLSVTGMEAGLFIVRDLRQEGESSVAVSRG